MARSVQIEFLGAGGAGLFLLSLVLFAVSASAHPEVDEQLKLVPLRLGANVVKLDGEGLTATVMIARRDNFNAHSFAVTTIYVTLQSTADKEPELKIVPVLGKEIANLCISQRGAARTVFCTIIACSPTRPSTRRCSSPPIVSSARPMPTNSL